MKVPTAGVADPGLDSALESDADIVAAVRGGDVAKFALLVRRHNERLYRIGIAYLRRADLVEDAMQNAYVQAFTGLRGFDGRATFSTWLSRIMINECLMQLRRMRREDRTHRACEIDPLRPKMDPGHAVHRLTSGEARDLIEHCVAGLPEDYRVVYVLREIQELDTAETAELTGLSGENVRVRLFRAREMLKEALLASAAGRELFRFTAERCDPFTARVMRGIHALPARAAAGDAFR